jgi:hypothetical protein
MIRASRAELVKILRRRVFIITGLAAAVFAVGGASLVLAAAEPPLRPGRASPIEALGDHGRRQRGHPDRGFVRRVLVFVVFVGAVAVEFGRGTSARCCCANPAVFVCWPGRWPPCAVAQGLTWIAARPSSAQFSSPSV